MAKINRKSIELFKQVNDLTAEPEFEKFYTSPYLTVRDTREAWVLSEELNNKEVKLTEAERIDKLVDFVANHAFKGQLTKQDIEERLVGGINQLKAVLAFVAFGDDPENLKK